MLNVKQIEALVRRKVRGRYRAAPGLYLQVDGDSASWLLRYRVWGRDRAMGPGALADAGLAKARQKAEEARLLVKGGVDPLEARMVAARAALAGMATSAAPAVPTFRQAAEEFMASQAAGWKNEKHADQWAATLTAYAYPFIRDRPVSAIVSDDVLAILRPIWTTKPETAARVRGRIEAVLDAAKVRGWREGENPARWKGHMALLLPKKAKVAAVKHHAALPWQDVPAFLAALSMRGGMAASALRFAILTAARSGEVRGATWREIDFAAATWVVPAARMKAGREHRVPLSEAALNVLKMVRPDDAEPDARVFPARGGGTLSDMSLTMLLRKMKRADGSAWTDSAGDIITAHGFRSAFRDWAGEATNHPREVIEQALAHGLKDKAEAAYARGDLLAKRARLMADWATFGAAPAAEIVAMTVSTTGPDS